MSYTPQTRYSVPMTRPPRRRMPPHPPRASTSQSSRETGHRVKFVNLMADPLRSDGITETFDLPFAASSSQPDRQAVARMKFVNLIPSAPCAAA